MTPTGILQFTDEFYLKVCELLLPFVPTEENYKNNIVLFLIFLFTCWTRILSQDSNILPTLFLNEQQNCRVVCLTLNKKRQINEQFSHDHIGPLCYRKNFDPLIPRWFP